MMRLIIWGIKMLSEGGVGSMNKFLLKYKAPVVAILVIGAVWLGWRLAFSNKEWHVKMTVTVQTPEGIKTGSAVWQICYHHEIPLIPAQGSGTYYHVCRGQAAVVDLGQYGELFGLISGDNPDYGHAIVLEVFPLREKTPIGTKVTLDQKQYPTLVRFGNLGDPKTLEYAVHIQTRGGRQLPTGIWMGVHFESLYLRKDIYGDKITLKSISLETVDEPIITQKVKKLLPWLSKVYGHYLSGKIVNGRSLYERLDTSAFVRGKN
jgi:hypothetical protein